MRSRNVLCSILSAPEDEIENSHFPGTPSAARLSSQNGDDVDPVHLLEIRSLDRSPDNVVCRAAGFSSAGGPFAGICLTRFGVQGVELKGLGLRG